MAPPKKPWTGFKRCAACKQEKTLAEFPPNKSQVFGVGAYCRPCAIEVNRSHYLKNRGHRIAEARRWYRDGGEVRRKRINHYKRLNTEKLRQQIWDRYGRVCACCGEGNLAFLSLDHIHNDGAEERRKLKGKDGGGGGVGFYRLLRRRGFPDGYQTLCFNCNIAKGRLGECPHQTQVKQLLESVEVPA